MIEKVIQLSKKSFKNYDGPTEKFKQKNVIFGYNGRGKSSLAFGLKDNYLKDATSRKDGLRFFDQENYVNGTLILNNPETGEKDKIRGVIAHFGEKDVENEEKIKQLKEKLVDTVPLSETLDVLMSDTRKMIETIHDRRKGTANIQKRDKNMILEDVIRLYSEDLEKANRIEADHSELSKIEGDNILGEKIELIKTVDLEIFDKITDQELTDAEKIFEKSFENIDIPASEVVDWINKGVEIHNEDDECKFCGGNFTLSDIKERVREYNANEKQKATKSLQALESKFAELQNINNRNLGKQASILSSLEHDDQVEAGFLEIQKASVVISNVRNVLHQKIRNIDDIKIEFSNPSEDLQKLNNTIESLFSVKSRQLKKLENQNINKDTLVKGAIGLEIINDKNIQSKLDEIKSKKSEINLAKNSNNKFNDQIQILKQSESATADFANYISEILVNLNIHLKLSVSDDDKNYIIQHTKTKDILTITDISEGERNLLALLFFYYELFDDNVQNNLKDTVEIIIVDDPISSVDDINKMYIIELMKQILALSTPQVFIMTHCWDDYTNICYGLYDNNNTVNGLFEIKKDASGNSIITKASSNISPYHHNFIEVYDFSQKPDTTGLDDCDIYHMPNITRQVLEGFLRFKIRKSSPTKSNEQEIARVLFDKEWTEITDADKTKLGQLLLVVNVNSHSGLRNPDEVLQSAKFLMSRIKIVDSRHFNTHKEPV